MNINSILGFSIGPVLSAFLGLAITPAIAWTFSPEEVGIFAIFQTVIALALIIVTLGLDQSFVREFYAAKDKFFLLKNAAAPGLMLLVVVVACGLFFAEEISEILFGRRNSILGIFVVSGLGLVFFSRFLSLILRMEERGWAYSVSQFAPKCLFLSFLLIYFFVPFDKNVVHLLFALVFSMFAVFLSLLVTVWGFIKKSFSAPLRTAYLVSLLKYGAPLVLASLAFHSISSVTIFFLSGFSSSTELAVYSITLQFSAVAMLVQAVFSLVWAPIVFKWEENGVDLSKVGDVAKSIFAFVSVFFSISALFSWVVDFLLPNSYWQVKYLIPSAMLPPLLYTLSVVTSVGIGLKRKSSISLVTSFLALLANLILCVCLVPSYGAIGAVISNALAHLLLFVINTEVSARIWRGFNRRRMYVGLSSAVLVSIFVALVGSFLGFFVWLIWAFVAIFSLVMYGPEVFHIGRSLFLKFKYLEIDSSKETAI